MPYWRGTHHTYQPFKNWQDKQPSHDWYKSYNSVKHDVANKLHEANFKNLILSISGLAVLITAQFNDKTFAKECYSNKGGLLYCDPYEQEKWENVTGNFFRVKKPTNIDSYNITNIDKIRYQDFQYPKP